MISDGRTDWFTIPFYVFLNILSVYEIQNNSATRAQKKPAFLIFPFILAKFTNNVVKQNLHWAAASACITGIPVLYPKIKQFLCLFFSIIRFITY